MHNFRFNAYTNMLFGKEQIEALPQEIDKFGKNVLLVYGGGSIKKNGIYDTIYRLLPTCKIIELAGVEPNPRIETVNAGVALCKEHQIEVVLAVGGGSTIDCAKVVAAGVHYDGDAWDIVMDPSKIGKVLPIITILTLAATGSEMNKNAVISKMDIPIKKGTSSWNMIPQTSILDPQYLYTLPSTQTAAGTADIMSHVFEYYFQKGTSTFIQDRFAEGILQACIKYCPIALQTPDHYEARANLMWASSMALNGLTGAGKSGSWTCHTIEHELSAYYDITHGVGLAIITPSWMRYILSDDTVETFATYARNVWRFENDDIYALANQGIDATEQFFIDCGLPMTLHEVGIDTEKFDIMAQKATENNKLQNAYVPLTRIDVIKILEMCK